MDVKKRGEQDKSYIDRTPNENIGLRVKTLWLSCLLWPKPQPFFPLGEDVCGSAI